MNGKVRTKDKWTWQYLLKWRELSCGCARGGKVYKYDFDNKVEIDIGTVVDGPTTFVTNNTVCTMDGTEFNSWDTTTFVTGDGGSERAMPHSIRRWTILRA